MSLNRQPTPKKKLKLGRWILLGMLFGGLWLWMPDLGLAAKWQSVQEYFAKKSAEKGSETPKTKDVSPEDSSKDETTGTNSAELGEITWTSTKKGNQIKWSALIASSEQLGSDRTLQSAHPAFLEDVQGELAARCEGAWPVQMRMTESQGKMIAWSFVCGDISASYEERSRSVQGSTQVYWTTTEGCLRGAPCWRWPIPQWVSWRQADTAIVFEAHVESEVRMPIDAQITEVIPSDQGFTVRMVHGMVWKVQISGIQQYGELPKVGGILKQGTRLGLIRSGLPVQWSLWRQGQKILPSDAMLWSWPDRKLRS